MQNPTRIRGPHPFPFLLLAAVLDVAVVAVNLAAIAALTVRDLFLGLIVPI